MKHLLAFAALFSLPFFLNACGTSESEFLGKWTGEAMTFEVISNGNGKVKIVNENGSLNGEIKNGKIVGKNELDMEFQMIVKGDSAFYTFAEITTAYARVK